MQPIATITRHEAIDHDELPVRNWRVSQLKRCGIPGPLAEAYAGYIDWHQAARAQQSAAQHPPVLVILDLGHRELDSMEVIRRLRDCTEAPIIVLSGLDDERTALEAVHAGAQDYLVKGRVEPEMLRRALLYAIERKRAEMISADLYATQLRARENALLERSLLPSPLLLDDPAVDIVARYRPSREDALLCGDFYDVVQTPDRVVHVVIGDVAGHGPYEAALGAALRIAFRTLTFAGVRGVEMMRQLERVLRSERIGGGIFATVLSLEIQPENPRVFAVRAGHPGMLLQNDGSVEWIEPPVGPALGLGADDWPSHPLELPAGHGLLLLTDGLFEGYSGRGNRRLGEDGLLALARSHASLPGPAFVDAVIDGAEQLAQPRGLTDDIAVLRVERTTR